MQPQSVNSSPRAAALSTKAIQSGYVKKCSFIAIQFSTIMDSDLCEKTGVFFCTKVMIDLSTFE